MMKTATKLRMGLIFCGLTVSALAGAQPSPSAGQPAAKPPKAEKAAAKPEAKADKAESKAEKGDGKSDPARPGVGPGGLRGGPGFGPHDPASHGGGGMGAHAHGGAHHGSGMGHGVGPHARMGGRFGAGYRGGVHQLLREEFQDGKIDKKQLEAAMVKLREQRDERRKEHRESVKVRWGDMLKEAPVRTELSNHARRIAFLNRALFVAQTDAKVKDREKLVARIEKLLDKEHERHDRAMARLRSTPLPPGSARAAGAAPKSSAAAALEEKGDQR